MIEHLQISDFLDPSDCAALRAELRQREGGGAALLADHGPGPVLPRVRKVTQVAAAPATRERITRMLLQHKTELEQHFAIALGECEQPQFLRYRTGDFFAAYQDGNTPLVFDRSRFRKISTVIFLSACSQEPAPESYGGGSLVLHGPYSGPPLRLPVLAAPGTLVAYRPRDDARSHCGHLWRAVHHRVAVSAAGYPSGPWAWLT